MIGPKKGHRGPLMRKINFPKKKDHQDQAKLEQLMESAPSLQKNSPMQSYTIMGSAILFVLLFGSFYAKQMMEGLLSSNSDEGLVEVDSAPEIKANRVDALIQKLETMEAEDNEIYNEILSEIKERNLLEELEAEDGEKLSIEEIQTELKKLSGELP